MSNDEYSAWGDDIRYWKYIKDRTEMRYLYTNYIKVFELGFKLVYEYFGIQTHIIEASTYKDIDNAGNHPGFSHARLNGLDTRHYGYEGGILNVSATYFIVNFIHKCLPKVKPNVGYNDKKQLENFINKKLNYIRGVDEYGHNFDKSNPTTHIHWDMNLLSYPPTINLGAQIEYVGLHPRWPFFHS